MVGLKVGQNMGWTPVRMATLTRSCQGIKILIMILGAFYPATTYTSGNLNASTSAESGIQVQQASSLLIGIVLGLGDVDVTQLQVMTITFNNWIATQIPNLIGSRPNGFGLLSVTQLFIQELMDCGGINVTIGLMLVQVTESVDTPQPTSTILPKNVGISA